MPLPRIIGGFEVSPVNYPWIVSLELNSKHNCGGVLVYDNFIATAAHCTTGNTKQWRAVITTENQGYKKFKIKSRYIHPKYNSSSFAHDTALWKAQYSIQKYLKPYKIYFDTGNHADSDETLGITMGWGTSDLKNKNYPTVLRQVEVPIVPAKVCKKITVYNDIDETSQFCAGYLDGGFDSCSGDSGGPIFTWLHNNVPFLLGLVSSGKGCAEPGHPGVYTKASSISELLLMVIKS